MSYGGAQHTAALQKQRSKRERAYAAQEAWGAVNYF